MVIGFWFHQFFFSLSSIFWPKFQISYSGSDHMSTYIPVYRPRKAHWPGINALLVKLDTVEKCNTPIFFLGFLGAKWCGFQHPIGKSRTSQIYFYSFFYNCVPTWPVHRAVAWNVSSYCTYHLWKQVLTHWSTLNTEH